SLGLASKEVGERFFIELQIQAGPPVPQQRGQHFLEGPGAGRAVFPKRVLDFEPDAVIAGQRRIDELMLDAFLSEIDQLSMAEFGEEQIMKELRRVPRGDGLHRLELEGAAASDQHVKILDFLERGVDDLDREFELYAGVAVSQ